MRELKIFVANTIIEHPALEKDILDLLSLCIDEIEDGESQENAIENCYTAIKQLPK